MNNIFYKSYLLYLLQKKNRYSIHPKNRFRQEYIWKKQNGKWQFENKYHKKISNYQDFVIKNGRFIINLKKCIN